MKNRYLTCTINSGVAPDDIVLRTGNAALVSMDALSFRGVGPDETYYSLRFRNKIVGGDDEESRWYWIRHGKELCRCAESMKTTFNR